MNLAGKLAERKNMSTSYVEFRGKGFWSWDAHLEEILRPGHVPD